MFIRFRFGIVTLIAVFSFASISPLHAVLYGDFDVYDYYEAPVSAFSWIADRTFVMVYDDDLSCDQETCSLYARSLFDYASLASYDPMAKFGDQPTLGFCSAFLAGSSTNATESADLVVTAEFCLPSDVSTMVFVLGWSVENSGDTGWDEIPVADVYQAAEIIADVSDDEEGHFAVVRLDRPVPMTPLLLAEYTTSIPSHEEVSCVGHSVGLPVKVHTNAWVKDNYMEDWYFTANLDVYAGIAGAPVVRNDTQEVIGILVFGETDWEPCGLSYCSRRLEDYDAYAETINRIDPVLPFLVGHEPPTIEELLIALVENITALNLQQGISNSLDAKLQNVSRALEDLNQKNDQSAINSLEAFISEVTAQSGKEISIAEADELISSAQDIIELILSG
jgi:hypothetical protein